MLLLLSFLQIVSPCLHASRNTKSDNVPVLTCHKVARNRISHHANRLLVRIDQRERNAIKSDFDFGLDSFLAIDSNEITDLRGMVGTEAKLNSNWWIIRPVDVGQKMIGLVSSTRPDVYKCDGTLTDDEFELDLAKGLTFSLDSNRCLTTVNLCRALFYKTLLLIKMFTPGI